MSLSSGVKLGGPEGLMTIELGVGDVTWLPISGPSRGRASCREPVVGSRLGCWDDGALGSKGRG